MSVILKEQTNQLQFYAGFAGLFAYPEDGAMENTIAKTKEIIDSNYPFLSDELNPFIAFVNSKTTSEWQEYYLKTFDIHASCYLDIGYVLFGEDYKRGQFLVNMRNEQINAGNDCGTELADHLPNMLTLLSKIKERNFAEKLAFSILIPALKEMDKNFIDEANVYKHLIKLLIHAMEKDFGHLNYNQIKINGKDKTNFLNNINCSPGKCGVKH